MNGLQIFKNDEFGEIRVIEKDGEPWFVGKDVADILGYSNTKDAISSHVDEEDKTIIQKSENTTFEIPNRGLTIINESGLYSLILLSKMPTAKNFKRWVTSDILPSIRKHGVYMTDNVMNQILNNPDFGIKLLTELKAEREERLKLQKEVKYKTEVIKGITDDIDLYTKRNVLNRVVRYKKANFQERWSELYRVFRETYSVDLKARCEGYNLKQIKKKDQLSVVKYAEKFGFLDDLYKVALKLYETDIREILDQLKKIA